MQQLKHGATQIRRRLDCANAGGLECAEFVRSRAFAASDDGACVAHALTGRSGDTRDIGNDRLANIAANISCASLLVAAADFADHDDALGRAVAFEKLQHIDKVHAAHRIAADADASALAKTIVGGLEDRLVGQRAGTRYHSNGTFFVNEARHDADLALLGRDDSGTVRPDQPDTGTR